jgi:hypothetical protein
MKDSFDLLTEGSGAVRQSVGFVVSPVPKTEKIKNKEDKIISKSKEKGYSVNKKIQITYKSLNKRVTAAYIIFKDSEGNFIPKLIMSSFDATGKMYKLYQDAYKKAGYGNVNDFKFDNKLKAIVKASGSGAVVTRAVLKEFMTKKGMTPIKWN